MKQRIAIVALLLTVLGGYLWWQGRPADSAPSSTAMSIFATSIWPFGSAVVSMRCWWMRGIA